MNIPEELKGKEITLGHLHLSEIAWRKIDALKLVGHLQSKGDFILGGDVLKKEVDGYRPNYDSWYLNQEDGDATQSAERARNYINKYPEGDYAFVFVVA
ncbi:Imm40 family immunity protein [Shewanella oncorhynchi]|uniref:Imm40 family immunity protein n=1 Tax=Shewanella oncorhynchi TaxID=2726434 RepID=UPI002E7B5EA9|nr:Imm40 family immunity protein [Shewanella oncorhynchi]WVI91570.1 Imm40 family immunity protein [Shewanella oncorhynchi]